MGKKKKKKKKGIIIPVIKFRDKRTAAKVTKIIRLLGFKSAKVVKIVQH